MNKKREISGERYAELSKHELGDGIQKMYEAGTWKYYIRDVSEKIRDKKADAAEIRNRIRRNALYVHEIKRRLRGEDRTSTYYKTNDEILRMRIRTNRGTEIESMEREKKLKTLAAVQAEYETAGRRAGGMQ